MIVAKDATGNALIFSMPPLERWISKVQVVSEFICPDKTGFVAGTGEGLDRTETKVKSLLAATPADIW